MSKVIKLASILVIFFSFRFATASCAEFDLEAEKPNIPIIVKGVVIESSEEVNKAAPSSKELNRGLLGSKKHKFSFKVTEVEKGYIKEGEVLSFNYVKSDSICPSTQAPLAKELWTLNISDVDRDNVATPYGTICSRLGEEQPKTKIKK